jgi:peptidoglycan/LPS O-acetylase OafA/YrhL
MTATVDRPASAGAEPAAPDTTGEATNEATGEATDEATDGATGERAGGRTGNRLYALDLLRFVAAALVVSYHVIPIYAVEYHVDQDAYFGHATAQVARYGYLGVYLFFLISGFVICMSSWHRSLGEFVTSRITRLAPAYLLAVVLTTALLYLWWPASFRPRPVDALANLTMVQGMLGVPDVDTVYWTLLSELKFYLLFAIVVRFGLTYRRVVMFCFWWTAAAVLAHSTQNELLTAIVQPGASYLFVGGIVLYLMYRFGPSLLLWLMLSASWIFSLVRLQERLPERGEQVQPVVAYTLLTVFFVAVAVVALGWTNWVRWRGLVAVGALTYPLYLIHFHVAQTALRELHGTLPGPVLLGSVIVALLVLSWLIHRFVERPVGGRLRTGLRDGFDRIRRTDPGRT